MREAPVGGYFDEGTSTNEECLASIRNCVLVNAPNTKTCYSNVGPTIVGRALEVQTGMTFQDYQRKNILNPLGMNDTAWELTDDVRRRLAKGSMRYNLGDGTFGFRDAPTFELGTLPAGSLVTTVSDLAKFAAFVMSSYSEEATDKRSKQLVPPLLKAETLHEMLTVQMTNNTEGFGLGFIMRNYRGCRIARHGGQLYGFCSLFSAIPNKGIGVIILTNGDEIIGPVRRLTDAAVDLLLEAVHDEPVPTPPKPLQLPLAELAKFAGEYESQSYWANLKFLVKTVSID